MAVSVEVSESVGDGMTMDTKGLCDGSLSVAHLLHHLDDTQPHTLREVSGAACWCRRRGHDEVCVCGEEEGYQRMQRETGFT